MIDSALSVADLKARMAELYSSLADVEMALTDAHEEIHEMADPRSGGAYHLRQRFLTDVRIDRLWATFLAEICEQQEQPCKPPLARIE